MKSIAERKKEREEREHRQRMKRSAGASGVYRRFGIPAYRLGWSATQGDLAFLKKKAENLLKACRDWAPHQFSRYIKEIILEEEWIRFEEQKKRDEMWNAAHPKTPAVAPVTVVPIVPATTPAPVTVSGEGSTQVVTNAIPAPSPVEDTDDWVPDPDFSNLVFSQASLGTRNRPYSIDHILPLNNRTRPRRRRRN